MPEVIAETSPRQTGYVTTVLADKTEWDSRFDPALANVALNAFEPGAEIWDAASGLFFKARKATLAPRDTIWWCHGNGVVDIGISAAAVTKNRLCKLTASNTYGSITVAGERYSGVLLNSTTGAGQRVYVLRVGKYLVENGGVAIAAGANVAVTANGRTQTAVAGNLVFGQCIAPSILIGATTFDLVSVGEFTAPL